MRALFSHEGRDSRLYQVSGSASGDRKIRVNCVAPGPVWTPLNVADKKERVAEHGKSTPYQRAAQPEEIAPLYVFFASEVDSSYITGEVVTLLGGQTAAA